jgi:hypothetical protein
MTVADGIFELAHYGRRERKKERKKERVQWDVGQSRGQVRALFNSGFEFARNSGFELAVMVKVASLNFIDSVVRKLDTSEACRAFCLNQTQVILTSVCWIGEVRMVYPFSHEE